MALKLSEYLYATVAYADIFDYPLTGDELYYRCLKRIPGKNLRSKLIPGVVKIRNVYYLKGRQSIQNTYKKRRESSKKKWEIARYIGKKLQIIPTIFMVGVTGGLAVNNASEKDDIDFYIVTARGTVWITRFIVVCLIFLYGKRRKPEDTRVADTICLNMIVSVDSMGLPSQEQDVFGAHEVIQMVPLWSRRDTYRRFLQSNAWIKVYLPVAWSVKKTGRNQHLKISYWWTRVARKVLMVFEMPAKYFQLWYMHTRRTREIVTDDVLRFHPKDARIWITKALDKRLRLRNIPLDKIFSAS